MCPRAHPLIATNYHRRGNTLGTDASPRLMSAGRRAIAWAILFALTCVPGAARGADTFSISDAARKHWAFQPVRAALPPQVGDSSWPVNDVDRFLLASLEAKGLRPNPAAD